MAGGVGQRSRAQDRPERQAMHGVQASRRSLPIVARAALSEDALKLGSASSPR